MAELLSWIIEWLDWLDWLDLLDLLDLYEDFCELETEFELLDFDLLLSFNNTWANFF